MSIDFTEKIVAYRYAKRRFISSLMKLEMQIKTAIEYHFIVTRLAKSKNRGSGKCWRKQNLLYGATASESVNR